MTETGLVAGEPGPSAPSASGRDAAGTRSVGEADDSGPLSANRVTIARVIAANTSVLIAALVCMGWAYQNAEYTYFHLNPLELNVSVVEYMLYTLNFLRPSLFITAAVAVACGAGFAAFPELRGWFGLRRRRAPAAKGAKGDRVGQDRLEARPEEAPAGPRLRLRPGNWPWPLPPLATAGLVITVGFVICYFADAPFSDYVYLAGFGIGPLLFTWSYRSLSRGRFAYATAVMIAAACAVYAGVLYAQTQGRQEAITIANGGGPMPDVTVYSTQPLSLSGHGIRAYPLNPGTGYRWRYEGLRLLTMRSGAYYLFPARPTFPETTYILYDSNGTQVELS